MPPIQEMQILKYLPLLSLFFYGMSCRFLFLSLIIVCLLLVGLVKLESINLSFTVVTDSGLRKLSGLSSLKSLNLDARQITDTGLAALTSKYAYMKTAF